MKTKQLLVIFSFSMLIFACSEATKEETNPIENQHVTENSTPKGEEKRAEPEAIEEEKIELAWNFKGSIGNIPIKAQLNFLEATNNEGTGAIQFPIKGYYFYESQNAKIPLEGEANGLGMIYFVAKTADGEEYFDGETVGDAHLENFAGTWSKGSKSLNFKLKSK